MPQSDVSLSSCCWKSMAQTAYWLALQSNMYGRFVLGTDGTVGYTRCSFSHSKAFTWYSNGSGQSTSAYLFNISLSGWDILAKLFTKSRYTFKYPRKIRNRVFIFGIGRLVPSWINLSPWRLRGCRVGSHVGDILHFLGRRSIF